jgi:TRAP-type C4-dicarboxylate transport system substrate-binding protein
MVAGASSRLYPGPMKTVLALTVALAFLAPAAPAHSADPVMLRFAYPAPPNGRANEWGFTPWVNEVAATSGGTVEIKIFPGVALGDYRNVYDRTINAVIDIAYGIFGPISSDFPKSMVTTLPFEAKNVGEASLALWRLYAKGVTADEYSRIKLLCLWDFSDSGFHTKRPIKVAADIKGMKLSVGTKVLGEIVEKLGGTPIQLQPSDYFQGIQRGTVEGATTAWPAVYPFKLQEVTNYHLDAPLGPAPAYVVMNKASFAKLPEAGRKAIDQLSGEHFTRRMADAAQRMDTEGRDRVLAMPGQHVTTLDPAEAARWKQLLTPITEQWVKDTPNGASELAAYRAELTANRAGK